MKHDWLIIRKNPPAAYDVYPSQDEAEKALPYVQAETQKEYDTIMKMDEYLALQRTFMLSDPLHEITKEKFIESLEVLPPINWRIDGDFERFLMSEFQTGSFTNEYARWGDRYFRRIVDAFDFQTWITPEECAQYKKED